MSLRFTWYGVSPAGCQRDVVSNFYLWACGRNELRCLSEASCMRFLPLMVRGQACGQVSPYESCCPWMCRSRCSSALKPRVSCDLVIFLVCVYMIHAKVFFLPCGMVNEDVFHRGEGECCSPDVWGRFSPSVWRRFYLVNEKFLPWWMVFLTVVSEDVFHLVCEDVFHLVRV